MSDAPLSAGAAARRLAAAIVTLLVLDLFVPGWLVRAERARYEGTDGFRFQYSDLFAVGPVVDYLREHPRGDRPRTVFFGNSVVWGYRLRVEQSLPVRFQRLAPDTRVFNLAVNGFGGGSAWLLLKDVIGSVDTVFMPVDGTAANRGLARLIPVSADDIARFDLERPDPVETRLAGWLGAWRLYRHSYRLQAALFGTSTRNFLYTHKAALVGGAISDTPPEGYADDPPGDDDVSVACTVAPPLTHEGEQALATRRPWEWEAGSLMKAHGRRGVFWRLAGAGAPPDADWAALNRAFLGAAVFAQIDVPADLMIDSRHLSARGSEAVARAFRALTTGTDQPCGFH